MKIKQVDYDTLKTASGSIKYRNQDIVESKGFGAINVSDNYVYDKFSKYYIIYKDNKPIVPIQIKRNGFINFFISSELEPVGDGLVLVKILKQLLKWWTDNYETTLFVKTAEWYKEANKLNKIIGFKKYLIADKYTIWTYNNNRIVNIPSNIRQA